MARKIMLQGTSSNVGKSILTAALCRIFHQDGYKVVPFKSQNMALNSAIAVEGGEIGRAQAFQAQAAGLQPSVRMNPILLKPSGNMNSQVIVLGKAIGLKGAFQYHSDLKPELLAIIRDCLDMFDQDYEVIIIEGAGSPAEVNLRDTDIANMKVAEMASSPVLLVADIDRGGALAAIVGTLELLLPHERHMVKGIIINKFRGHIGLLQPALDFLEAKTGIPVLGVIPYLDLHLPEEDSVALEAHRHYPAGDLDVAVIRLPLISNFTDFDALMGEPDVKLRYVRKPEELGKPDLLIIPGSKNTIEDTLFLHHTGFTQAILAQEQTFIVGICGGYQILGCSIADPAGVEARIPKIDGLGLLPVDTIFQAEKTTVETEGELISSVSYLAPLQGKKVAGYEIHMGQSYPRADALPLIKLTRNGNGNRILDGVANKHRPVIGTYLHGLFDADDFRRSFLNLIRLRKGLEPIQQEHSHGDHMERELNRLARVVRESLNLPLLYRIMELPYNGR